MTKIIKKADLSPDGQYRYRLERINPELDPEKALSVVMVNPSTADDRIDDPTIRRLMGFANNYGFGRLIVCNLFAYRTPLVTDLKKVADPVGPDNWRHLSKMMEESKDGRVVAAFGSYSKIPALHLDCVDKFRELADIHLTTLYCWGKNKDGSPKHPLYLPSGQGLELW